MDPAQFLGIDIDKIVAALFIVSQNTGAYMSEIVRGGIVSYRYKRDNLKLPRSNWYDTYTNNV